MHKTWSSRSRVASRSRGLAQLLGPAQSAVPLGDQAWVDRPLLLGYSCFVKRLAKMSANSTSRLLQALWDPDGATRRELESSLGLSRPTVDRALADLVSRGLVVPVGTRSLRGGRPATVYRLDGSVCSVVGVDLELPQLTFVLSDLWGNPQESLTLALDGGSEDPVPLLRQVGEELTEWLTSLSITWPRVGGVGVALPAFVTNGVASFAGETMPSWRGVTVREILEREIPARVHVHHDTHVMALAEAWGSGWTEGTLLYVALRPGLAGEVRFGASLLVDGRPYQGAHGHGGSLYRAYVAREEMEGCSAKERVDLLVERAVGFLVHAITLLDPERVVFHAELLGADAEAFLAGCRRRLRMELAGEFPDQHKVTLAVERGPAAARGAAIAVVGHLRDNPEALFTEQGGERGRRSSRAKRNTVTPRRKGGRK